MTRNRRKPPISGGFLRGWWPDLNWWPRPCVGTFAFFSSLAGSRHRFYARFLLFPTKQRLCGDPENKSSGKSGVSSSVHKSENEKGCNFASFFILELMTRFELVTPSLPRTCSTDWATSAYYNNPISKHPLLLCFRTLPWWGRALSFQFSIPIIYNHTLFVKRLVDYVFLFLRKDYYFHILTYLSKLRIHFKTLFVR